ncbi:IS200/IS605 family transposase [Dyadobacter sp. MSC1_007]|jgi:putative transposase|uniref:IS200/IS605 family transposase n=1 Tax=Dyadobacter sp. MSC1_007 TaxID=2909264 RepID=UPI00202DD0EF|nr:IS200/IS605 family transposase [Dyadobacter sp. MSC1_007]
MSYVKIWIHAVWATKHRRPFLKPPVLGEICKHIRVNARSKGIFIDRINGHDDHVHVLMLLKSELSISKQMQLLKGESAFWANKVNLVKDGLEWSVKYFAASVSDSKLDIVRRYIDNQQAHHRKKAFKEEFKSFVRSLGYSDDDLD